MPPKRKVIASKRPMKKGKVTEDDTNSPEAPAYVAENVLSEAVEPETGKKTVTAKKKSQKASPNAASSSKALKAKGPTSEEPTEGTTTGSLSTEKIKDGSKDGRPWNLKIMSWNVGGLRSWVEKHGQSFVLKESPGIFFVQETKCKENEVPSAANLHGYHHYWSAGDKGGYAGTGLLTKEKPINVTYGMGIAEHDSEGRLITAEFEDFYLVGAYVPNSGRGLPRLDYRMQWNKDFLVYLKRLDTLKPVILCGDLNVAHEEIDLANPKTNHKTAGFTNEEREDFNKLLKAGFVDVFRHLYPEKTGAYTFWSYMRNARGKNIGWRLDYFAISERLVDSLSGCILHSEIMGSDHCPLSLFMKMKNVK